jgi:hypothetical protein
MQGVLVRILGSGQMTPPRGPRKGSREARIVAPKPLPGSGATDPNPKLPRASGYVRDAPRRVTRAGCWKWSRKYPHRIKVTYRGLRPDREKLLFGSRVFSAAYCETTQRRDLTLGCRSYVEGVLLADSALRHFRDCKVEV